SSRSTSASSSRTLPLVTGHTRLSALMSVVFPAPLGPTSANIPVSGRSRSRPSTATSPPKRTVTRRASSIERHRRSAGPIERQPLRGSRAQQRLEPAGEKQDDEHDHAAQQCKRKSADRRG